MESMQLIDRTPSLSMLQNDTADRRDFDPTIDDRERYQVLLSAGSCGPEAGDGAPVDAAAEPGPDS